MEYISTTKRRGASNTGAIPIHHICVGEGDNVGSGNGSDDDEKYIMSSSSSSYWGQTTKQTKEEILQRHVVLVKIKRVPKVSMERNIHHANATKALL